MTGNREMSKEKEEEKGLKKTGTIKLGSGTRKEKRRMKERGAMLSQLATVATGKISPEIRQATNRRKPAKRCPWSQKILSCETLAAGVGAWRNKVHLKP